MPLDLSPLRISFATTVVATAFTFVLGVLAAKAMYGTKGRMRGWIDGVLTLPLVLPPTVVGFLLLLAFGRRSVIGQALEHLGFTIAFSWPATVIAAVVVAFPLMYRTALGGFEQVNPTLLEAARTLGASEWRVFRRVLLPLAWPGVLAGTVLASARALGEFGATLMLAGNIPGRTQTLPIAIFSAAEGGDMRTATVWVLLIIALSFGIIALLNYERTGRPSPPQPTTGSSTGPISIATSPAETIPGVQSARLEMAIAMQLQSFRLDVQLMANRGTLGLLGASGSGKSMTLRAIAGLVTPDRGRIIVNDRVLYASTDRVNLPPAERRVSIVFQDYALFPHMTVAENVAFGLNKLESSERSRRVIRQLQLVHIADLSDRYPGQLSGGQRQRVALARALATAPDVLLLDEPFAALDPHLRRQMEEQLREALAGYAGVVLFVTHDVGEAFRFCVDLVVVDYGKIISAGRKQELFERPGTVTAARLTGCKNIAAAKRLSSRTIEVAEWNCQLTSAVDVGDSMTHVGIRAHHLVFTKTADAVNTFTCWPVATSEAPFEITVYLCLNTSPIGDEAPHLQIELAKDAYCELQSRPLPWHVELNPEKLLLLQS